MVGFKSEQVIGQRQGFVSQLVLMMVMILMVLIQQISEMIIVNKELLILQQQAIEDAVVLTSQFEDFYHRLENCEDGALHYFEILGANGFIYQIEIDDNHQVMHIQKE